MFPIADAQTPTRKGLAGPPAYLAVAAVLAILAIPLGLARCSPPEHRAGCVVAVDRSPSVADEPGMQAKYERWVRSALRSCAEIEAHVRVVPLTNNTEADAMGAVTADFRSQDTTGDPLTDAPIIDRKVDALMAKVRAMLGKRPNSTHGGTDLISLPRVASREFSGLDETRRMIVVSDGLSTRSPAPLHKLALDGPTVDAVIGHLADDGFAAHLDGVHVAFVGAGLGHQAAALSSGRLAGVERFWRTWLASLGAQVDAYDGDLGSAEISFNS